MPRQAETTITSEDDLLNILENVFRDLSENDRLQDAMIASITDYAWDVWADELRWLSEYEGFHEGVWDWLFDEQGQGGWSEDALKVLDSMERVAHQGWRNYNKFLQRISTEWNKK